MDQARAFAGRIGITSPIQSDAGAIAGAGIASVTPKELANAYATFASGGLLGQPYLVRAIGGKPEPRLSSPRPSRPRSPT